MKHIQIRNSDMAWHIAANILSLFSKKTNLSHHPPPLSPFHK